MHNDKLPEFVGPLQARRFIQFSDLVEGRGEQIQAERSINAQ